MSRLRELRTCRLSDIVDRIGVPGIDIALCSRFENDFAVPSTKYIERLESAYGADRSVLWASDELRYGVRAKKDTCPSHQRHKLTVRVSDDDWSILTDAVIKACGYRNKEQWISECIADLKSKWIEVTLNECLRKVDDGAGEAESTEESAE